MFPPISCVVDGRALVWWPWLTLNAQHAGGWFRGPCWDRMCPQHLHGCPHGRAPGTWRRPQLERAPEVYAFGAVDRQDGWVELSRPDPHRGLWYRAFPSDSDATSTIELRSGREGDDGFVSLHVGQTLTDEDIRALHGCLLDLLFAREMASEPGARLRAIVASLEEIERDTDYGGADYFGPGVVDQIKAIATKALRR